MIENQTVCMTFNELAKFGQQMTMDTTSLLVAIGIIGVMYLFTFLFFVESVKKNKSHKTFLIKTKQVQKFVEWEEERK